MLGTFTTSICEKTPGSGISLEGDTVDTKIKICHYKDVRCPEGKEQGCYERKTRLIQTEVGEGTSGNMVLLNPKGGEAYRWGLLFKAEVEHAERLELRV